MKIFHLGNEFFGVPGRCNSELVAEVVGCQPHDVPILIAARLLKPLGNPAANAPRYFATRNILAHAQDPVWLEKATKAIANHWKKKNQRRKSNRSEPALPVGKPKEVE